MPGRGLVVRFTHDGKYLGHYTLKNFNIDKLIDNVISHNADIHLNYAKDDDLLNGNRVPKLYDKGLKDKYIQVLEYIYRYGWVKPKNYSSAFELIFKNETRWDKSTRVVKLFSDDEWNPDAKELIIRNYIDESLWK